LGGDYYWVGENPKTVDLLHLCSARKLSEGITLAVSMGQKLCNKRVFQKCVEQKIKKQLQQQSFRCVKQNEKLQRKLAAKLGFSRSAASFPISGGRMLSPSPQLFLLPISSSFKIPFSSSQTFIMLKLA